ncbi:MAG: hypothetical protein IPP77_13640 [Bacteroidetes bacterium]|nr:hypothetical protein [Bacteroidota bacterium]
MESKTIFYIVAGVGYFIYSMWKASQERKQQKEQPSQPQKPVTPPTSFGDILRELQKHQQPQAPAKPVQAPKPIAVAEKRKPRPDTLLDEMRRASDTEVNVTARAAELENKRSESSLYHIQSEEELAQAAIEHQRSFDLDVRQAFIGSLVFERKY